MAVPSIFAFFVVVTQLVILHSTGEEEIFQRNCRESFNCGTFGQIKFPFSNDTCPHCGLMVNCSQRVPKILLGWGFWGLYEVKEFLNGEVIKVSSKWQEKLISFQSCDLFSNLILPIRNTTSISFAVSPNLTLFKCMNSSHELDLKADDCFRGYHSYTGCLGYTLYYTYPNLPVPTPDNLPHNCQLIDLPAVPPNGKQNPSHLISLLSDEFSIGFHVSNECRECHLKRGQCSHYLPKFRCIEEKKVVAGRRLSLKLILGAAAAGIGILVILMFCIIRKLAQSESTVFWKNETESYRNVEGFLKNYGSLSPKRYTYSDIKKMTNSFRAKLGQGGYGCVFKGKLENGRLVAVKVLKGLKGSGEEFINEVATISRTSHVNIVTLLGFCSEGRSRALIYEFMPNGSLEKFIYHPTSLAQSQLVWEALFQIAIGVARGLEYLHRGCNMRILHLDIKPHNILLDEDFCPKISDFGLARLCPRKESIVISLSGTRGTAGYIAPEVFSRTFGGVSHKSDVYSYGMMILEMVGARNNIDIGVDGTSDIYFPDWIYKRLELDNEIGQHGITNQEENEGARKMIIVGLWCILTDPLSRPAMSRVVDMLQGSLESLQIPPIPFLSSPSRAPADSSTTDNKQLCSSIVG